MKLLAIVLLSVMSLTCFAAKSIGTMRLTKLDQDDEKRVSNKCGYEQIRFQVVGGDNDVYGEEPQAHVRAMFVNYYLENDSAKKDQRTKIDLPFHGDEFHHDQKSGWHKIAGGKKVCVTRVRIEGRPLNSRGESVEKVLSAVRLKISLKK